MPAMPIRSRCRWSALSRSRTRSSPPALTSRPAAIRRACSARWKPSRRQRPARTRRTAKRRAGLCRLCAQAGRAGQGAERLASLCQRQAHRGVRRRRRPRPRQAPGDGRIAAEHADRVIVTDDNPRSESRPRSAPPFWPPRRARSEIGDRARGDPRRHCRLQPGDVLLVAGKGHETGQIVGDEVLPFSDHEAVAAAVEGKVA